MNQVQITLNKVYSVKIDNRVPMTANSLDRAISLLNDFNFTMIRISFDNYCYADASEKIRTREYNNYMKRINKIANNFNMKVESVENMNIDGHTFPHKHIAVLI